MRIIFVTDRQFDFLWMKASPVQRVSLDIPFRNMYIYSRAVLFVAGTQAELIVTTADGALEVEGFYPFLEAVGAGVTVEAK